MHSATLSCSSIALAGRPLAGPRKPRRALPRAQPPRAVAEPPPVVPFNRDSDHLSRWSPTSWRNFEALQQPAYPDKARSLVLRGNAAAGGLGACASSRTQQAGGQPPSPAPGTTTG